MFIIGIVRDRKKITSDYTAKAVCHLHPEVVVALPVPVVCLRVDGRMAPRLTKIYTRTGDAGTTGLADGSRISKDDARIEAIGAVDELNSMLGLLLCEELPGEV